MDFISIDDDIAGFVQHYDDSIDDGVHTITYTGIELKGLSERRIVIPASGEAYQHYYNKEPEYIIAELLDKQILNPADSTRRIYGTIAPYTSYHSGITYDGRYQVLSEEIIELATAYDIGWCASIEDSTIVWKIWNGVDRTATQTENNRMILDYDYGTMNNSTLSVEDTVPTFMVVAGQGEGAKRAIEELNNGAAGLKRIETFLDARDVEDDNLLSQRGQEKLAEYGDSSSYTATLSNQAIQQYRTEYELGDIGTVRDSKLDGAIDYRITAVEEVYEDNQLMVNIVLGYNKNTLKDSIQRMNSKRDALLAVESYSGGSSSGGGGGCDCEPLTTTEDGNGNVIVSGGCVSTASGSSMDKTAIVDLIYPVGSIYLSMSSTNPSLLFGGTWSRQAAGRVLVGQWDGMDKFKEAGNSGGEFYHTLTVDELPNHTHTATAYQITEGTISATDAHLIYKDNTITSWTAENYNWINDTGGGQAHNNMQPYVVCYIWQRIA